MNAITLCNLITFAWLMFWALNSYMALIAGVRKSIYLVFMFHFLLCGLPLLLDEFVRQPGYETSVGFYHASRDDTTCLVYCAYVSFVPLFWHLLDKTLSRWPSHTSVSRSRRQASTLAWVQPALSALVALPLLFLLLAPDKEVYLTYMAVSRSWPSATSELYHHYFIATSTKLSVIALTAKLYLRGRLPVDWIVLWGPFWLLDVWLDGKRTLVALSLVLLPFSLWCKGVLAGRQLALSTVFVVAVLGGFSHWYQVAGDRVLTGIGDTFYDNFRVDYGRDDVIKLAIYCETQEGAAPILDYRGQSIVFYLTFFIPRDIWPDKPYPYAQYMTSAVLGMPPRLWDWGMTTSCLDEGIANCGSLGFLLGPLVPFVVCWLSDRSENTITRLTGPLVALLLMALHAVAIAPLVMTWIASLGYDYLYCSSDSNARLPSSSRRMNACGGIISRRAVGAGERR